MKTRLLILILLLSGIHWGYSQNLPSKFAEYNFANGSLVNVEDPGNGDLTKTGTNSVLQNDRFGQVNNAIALNGDTVYGAPYHGGTGLINYTMSFWFNTAVNNIDKILWRTYNNFGNEVSAKMTSTGNFLIQVDLSGTPNTQQIATPNYLLDGNWHHVVITLEKYVVSGAGRLRVRTYLDRIEQSNLYMDNIPYGQIWQASVANGGITFADAIDDVQLFGDTLTDSDVLNLYNDYPANLVNIPDANFKAELLANASINTNADNAIDINEAFSYSGFLDVSNKNIQSLKGIEWFENINGLNASNNSIDAINLTTNFFINSLDVSNNILHTLEINNGNNTIITNYNSINNTNLQCVTVDDVTFANANFTNKDPQTQFNTFCERPIYVDVNATGNNSGINWTNAYSNLRIALSENPNATFWVKAGTYTPGASRAEKLFLTDGQKLYGGFNGTESLLSDRDPLTKVTIISGDLMGNDSGPISVSNTTRSDNSYRLIEVSGDNVVIDGITLSGGQADGTVSTENGFAAVIKFVNGAGTFFMVNCIVRDNVSIGLSNIRNVDVSTSTNINFLQTQFFSNVASRDVIYYSRAANPQVVNTNMESCLFYFNETTASNESGLIWIRQDPSGNQNFIFNNCTVADNEFAHAGPVIDASRINGTISARIYNSIFWDNVTASTNNIVLGNGQWSAANLRQVRNCIDPLGFTNVPDRGSIVTTNPLFENATLGNYRLQTASPAKDAGDNQFVTSAMPTDLDGNMRIFNGTVDMGAYEFGSTLGTENFQNKITQFKIYPNPVNEVLNISIEGKIKNIEVYNMLGSRIFVSTNNSINVSAFQNGIYIIKVTNMFNQQITKRFIKQ